jgi:hypothetical protein
MRGVVQRSGAGSRQPSRSTSAGRKLVEVKERRRPTGGSSSGSTVEFPWSERSARRYVAVAGKFKSAK